MIRNSPKPQSEFGLGNQAVDLGLNIWLSDKNGCGTEIAYHQSRKGGRGVMEIKVTPAKPEQMKKKPADESKLGFGEFLITTKNA